MTWKSIAIIAAVVLLPITVMAVEPAKPISIDDILIVKISASDQRTVIKTPDGVLTMIKAGDAIGAKAVVVEISDNRVVLNHKTDDGPETVIIRLVNGKQTVEKMKKTMPKQPLNPMRQVNPGKK